MDLCLQQIYLINEKLIFFFIREKQKNILFLLDNLLSTNWKVEVDFPDPKSNLICSKKLTTNF
jgi:hypothetical protein